jgi:hypothetical protein
MHNANGQIAHCYSIHRVPSPLGIVILDKVLEDRVGLIAIKQGKGKGKPLYIFKRGLFA